MSEFIQPKAAPETKSPAKLRKELLERGLATAPVSGTNPDNVHELSAGGEHALAEGESEAHSHQHLAQKAGRFLKEAAELINKGDQ